jgi:arylsulfatase A-like enzyme
MWQRSVVRILFVASILIVNRSNADESTQHNINNERRMQPDDSSSPSPPNIIVFVVDDLGWNQVGYHAKPSGNDEIRTPHIDYYATEVGIELDRGYMTPWCGPSRAAIITGRTNVYNFNISSLLSTFDDDIGYVAGLQPGTKTLATALKEYGASVNKPYTTWFNGKWGIGVSNMFFLFSAEIDIDALLSMTLYCFTLYFQGTAFANTPLGMGFDEFRGFWGTGLETCGTSLMKDFI